MGWVEITNKQDNLNIPDLEGLNASLTNVGDYIGKTAILKSAAVANDLTTSVGKLVSFVTSASFNRGKWALVDSSSSSQGSRSLMGIVTSDTTASVPVILIEGIIKLDGDTVNPAVGLTEADDEHGYPVYSHPNYNGQYTTEPNVTFATGNLVRQLGYVIDFDSTTPSGTEEFYMMFKPDNFFMSL